MKNIFYALRGIIRLIYVYPILMILSVIVPKETDSILNEIKSLTDKEDIL